MTVDFAVGERDFLLDGEPFRILSGALHYFRVHPAQWADRIRKARQLGLNTIETYVAWNAHAPASPDEFRLDGGLDLGRFLDLVAAEGLFAIVRPGPYICAEWTGGGLPGWLRPPLRTSDPRFLEAVGSYLGHLSPVLAPRQGSPVILVQVENEYGAYGSDTGYLGALADLLREHGITVPLFTVDQPAPGMLGRGSLPGVLAAGSFGSDITERISVLRARRPSGPLLCAEFWNGWFDDWGGHHHVTPAAGAARDLDALLRAGASVNLYMFGGGTNFGLTSGANDKGTYQPVTTSYDYDAPLDEAGNPTEKYWAFRDVIARYAPVPADVPAAPDGPAPAFTVPLGPPVPLWDVLDRLGSPSEHDAPPTADDLGQYQGLTLYAADLPRAAAAATVLSAGEVRDRAQVFLDRAPAGVLARDHRDTALPLPPRAPASRPSRPSRLEILVEDQGRVGYGPRIGEPKGLIGPVTVGGEPVRGWDVTPLPLDDIGAVAERLRTAASDTARAGAAADALAGPAFARAVFDLPRPGPDLFLDTRGWGKGIAWLNGFCLGRYWSRGPQRTLYVPGPVTRERGNELVILELHAATAAASFAPAPGLGHTEP